MAEQRPQGTPAPPVNSAMQLARMHLWHFQAVRDALVVAAILALIWAGYAMRAVTVPLLVALLLAYLFEPLVSRLSSHPSVRRPFVVGALLSTVGVASVLVMAFSLPVIVHQTTRFLDDVREGRFAAKAAELREYVPENFREDYDAVFKLLSGRDERAESERPAQAAGTGVSPSPSTQPLTEERIAEIVDRRLAERAAQPLARAEPAGGWLGLARGGTDTIIRVLGAVVQIGLLAFLIPFYFFFFSVSFPSVVKFSSDLIPRANRQRVLELIHKMDRAVAGFVRGRIVICFIMAVMLAVGWMMCGVPYALLLGLIVGVFSLVPYLGGVGLPLAIGMLLYGQLGEPEAQRMVWWQIILWPSLVFAIVQFVEGYILTPLISGKATNLDPVTIVVAVLAGGSVAGVYGMLLAIPVAACAKILITDVLLPRIRAWTEGRAADPLPLDRG